MIKNRLPVEVVLVVLGFSLLALLLYSEWQFPFSPTYWLWPRSLIIVGLWLVFPFLKPRNAQFLTKSLRFSLVFLALIGIGHFLLNILNIYHLHEQPLIAQLCSSSQAQTLCQLNSKVFYGAKIYRLMTFSALIFLQPLLVVIGWWLISSVPTREVQTYFRHPVIKRLLHFACVLVLLVFVQTILVRSYADTVQSILNWSTPFDDRFTYKLGGASYDGWIWPYTQFIKAMTSENSLILIPPQTPVWKMEGNEGYLRWFLYPRNLAHVGESLPPEGGYILLVQGSCQSLECAWPNFSLPTERVGHIWLIHRETQEVKSVTQSEYAALSDSVLWWGIMELKSL